jgi:hypothetical protein
MRYVPTGATAPTHGPADPAAEPTAPANAAAAARRAVHDLRIETERRGAAPPAWATRTPRPASGRTPALPDATAAGENDPLDLSDPVVALLAQLRTVMTRYVRGLRATGARPEQMLVQVKGFVRDAMTADGWRDPEAARVLTAEVVRWSIAAYYDP